MDSREAQPRCPNDTQHRLYHLNRSTGTVRMQRYHSSSRTARSRMLRLSARRQLFSMSNRYSRWARMAGCCLCMTLLSVLRAAMVGAMFRGLHVSISDVSMVFDEARESSEVDGLPLRPTRVGLGSSFPPQAKKKYPHDITCRLIDCAPAFHRRNTYIVPVASARLADPTHQCCPPLCPMLARRPLRDSGQIIVLWTFPR